MLAISGIPTSKYILLLLFHFEWCDLEFLHIAPLNYVRLQISLPHVHRTDLAGKSHLSLEWMAFC